MGSGLEPEEQYTGLVYVVTAVLLTLAALIAVVLVC